MPAPAVANPEEYRAALEACAVVDLSAHEVVRVTGPDRVSFVHGMVTNDVEGLAVGASCYAALLTAKGAMVGDARVLKRVEELVLETGAGRGGTVREFLEKYLISEEAETFAAPELAVVGLAGPKSAEAVEKIPADARLGTLVSPLGVDVLVKRESLEAVRAALAGLPTLSDATLEVLRVERGVPVFGVDMTETTIPLEANLDRAISLTKGCYIGQEVIARATYRGQMNKRLVGLLLGEVAPEKGTELRKADKKVGWVTSVVRSIAKGQVIALGYVHRDHLQPGTVLDVASGGQAIVSSLPFSP